MYVNLLDVVEAMNAERGYGPPTTYVVGDGAITITCPASKTLAKMIDHEGRTWWSIIDPPQATAIDADHLDTQEPDHG